MTLWMWMLIACDKEEDTGEETALTNFEQIIDISSSTSGEFSCFTPGGDWLEDTADAACLGEPVPVDGFVEDFETEDPVPDATIELYFSDSISGSFDSSMVTGSDGNASGAEAPVCEPISYMVYTDPALDETRVTIEAHQVLEPSSSGNVQAVFNSVSSDTYRIIPALLGLSVDETRGIIAGTAYDCNGEKIEGAQVIVREPGVDGDEGYIEQAVHYFVDDFPARDQLYTSADGLWIAVNIPTGEKIVEMWAVLDESVGPELLGQTRLEVIANSINISNIKVGYEEGIFLPDACLDCSSR